MLKDNSFGWVIFENPARMNALSEDMSGEAVRIIDRFAEDEEVRVVILRGAGKKAFISGGDISKFDVNTNSEARTAPDRQNFDLLKSRLQSLEKPVLAMIFGYCLGGGLGLALSADVRLAATTARLGIPAANRALGYPPEYIQQLVEIVGPANAKDILFSGRQIEAGEAARLGLVNRVIATESLERETRGYAQAMSENAPLTIKAAKYCINEVMRPEAEQDWDGMRLRAEKANNSEDFQEATRSFLEKRKPVFRGI